MRSLEDIFGFHERTILFEDGKWCIYRKEMDRCYIIHRCANIKKAENTQNTTCHCCGTEMPEELRGLFALNEWER